MQTRCALSLSCVVLLAMLVTVAGGQDGKASWRALPLIADGKLAADWKQVGFGQFVVEGDHLRAEPSEKGLGLLVYAKEKLGNCQIRIVYRPQNARSNSGIYIRIDDGILDWIGRDSIAVRREANGKLSPAMLDKMKEASAGEQAAWYAVHHGYEVQIIDGGGDAMHRTGSIYSLAPAEKAPEKSAGEWRTMTITLDGNLVLVEQEGKALTRFDSTSPNLPERKNWFEPKREHPRPQVGYFGLQTHDPGDVVEFKEVSVRELTK